MVGGAAHKLGNGGYDLGARAQQIRDALRAQERFDETGLHAIRWTTARSSRALAGAVAGPGADT